LPSLLSLALLLPLAPIRKPSSVFEPLECRLFVRKAPNVDPLRSCKRFDVLLGESEFLGIARHRNSVLRHHAKRLAEFREPVLLDFERRP